MGKESNTSELGRTEREQGIRNILKLSDVPFLEFDYTKFTENKKLFTVKSKHCSEAVREVIEGMGYVFIKDNPNYFVIVQNDLAWAHQNILSFAEGMIELQWILKGQHEEFFTGD